MIPLVAPHITWEDREYVKGRIDEGLLADESEVRALEEAFAERFGYLRAFAVSSGTAALTVAIASMVEAGTDLAIPTYTCEAVLLATRRAGCSPVLVDNYCDIQAADFHMIAPDEPSVLPFMFGRAPASLPHRAIIDLTLSLGVEHIPTNLAVCSLRGDKMLSAGRGGMILVPAEWALLTDALRGRTASYAMSATQAALAMSQLSRLDEMIARRRELAAYYTDQLRPHGFECPDITDDNVFFRYLIGVLDPARDVMLLAEHGIECGRGVNPPLHQMLGLPPDEFPGAEECFDRLLSIPVHPGVRERRRVVDAVLATCTPG